MNNKDSADILRYATNMFAFPKGYFSEHTAEELRVSEAVRKQLIEMQNEEHGIISYDEAIRRKREAFLTEMEK